MKLDARKLGLVGGQDFRQNDPAARMGYSDGKLSCGEILNIGDFLVVVSSRRSKSSLALVFRALPA